ncbi:MAG: hypothetical protein AAGA08_01620 [Pseudomonadota bacterium]
MKSKTFDLSRRSIMLGSSAEAAFVAARARSGLAQSVPASINDIAKGATFRWIDTGGQKAVFFKKFFADYAADREVEVVYDPLP